MTYSELKDLTIAQWKEANKDCDGWTYIDPDTPEFKECEDFELWEADCSIDNIEAIRARRNDRAMFPEDWKQMDDGNMGLFWCPNDNALNRLYEIYKQLKHK